MGPLLESATVTSPGEREKTEVNAVITLPQGADLADIVSVLSSVPGIRDVQTQ